MAVLPTPKGLAPVSMKLPSLKKLNGVFFKSCLGFSSPQFLSPKKFNLGNFFVVRFFSLANCPAVHVIALGKPLSGPPQLTLYAGLYTMVYF